MGYAATRFLHPDGVVRKTTLHRKVFFERHGYLPEIVRHTCDNARCVNPDHLIGGTQVDNVRDMYERGRQNNPGSPGTSNGRAVLSEADVQYIRDNYRKHCRANGLPSLARKFGVGTSQIWRIVQGEHWKTDAQAAPQPDADVRQEDAPAAGRGVPTVP